MCGICGTTRAGDGAALAAMNGAMEHRGPDDAGVFVDAPSGVGLAARRLSIIDVAGGHQPLANEDETIWAVLNGEIYNYPALRERLLGAGHVLATRTDTEALVHLYEDFGDELVHALEGMFAFAVWDRRRRRLVVGRDRFGEKPLFYSERGGRLTFASELTALVQGVPGGHELDPSALDDYFTHGYVSAPASVVRGVYQLEPGRVLTWTPAAGVKVRTYWSPPRPDHSIDASLPEAVQEARLLLDASVRSRLMADVPLGVFLSGGVDSSLVAALAARHSRTPLKTFTVGYDVGEVNETQAARRVAEAIGAEHHELIVAESEAAARAPELLAALDQPLADQAFVPLRLLAEFARREVTVVVGGEGADELFAGYPRYRWLARSARLPARLRRLPLSAAARRAARLPGMSRADRLEHMLAGGSMLARHVAWVAGVRPGLRPLVYGPRLREHVHRSALHGYSPVRPDGDGDVLGALMLLDQTRWLPNDVLAKADRASMQASLELRTPFLHRQLAELASSLPGGLHSGGGGKVILRRVLSDVLPGAPTSRRKLAFRAPASAWLRGPLAPELDRQLRSSALYADGWFDAAAVRALTDQHRRGRHELAEVLWPLFALGAWIDAGPQLA